VFIPYLNSYYLGPTCQSRGNTRQGLEQYHWHGMDVLGVQPNATHTDSATMHIIGFMSFGSFAVVLGSVLHDGHSAGQRSVPVTYRKRMLFRSY
jgi:hypothetical protein